MQTGNLVRMTTLSLAMFVATSGLFTHAMAETNPLYENWDGPRRQAMGHDFTRDWSVEFGHEDHYLGMTPPGSLGLQFPTLQDVGIEDATHAGANLHYRSGGTRVTMGLFSSTERGSAIAHQRQWQDLSGSALSVDRELLDEPRYNRNTLALRLARELSLGNDRGLELGVSGMYGNLYNGEPDESGSRWAAAAHGLLSTGNFNLRALAGAFESGPEEELDRDLLIAYALSTDPLVPQEGNFYLAGAAYTIPMSGLLDYVQLYNHYSVVTHEADNQRSFQRNVAGALISSGSLFSYFEFESSRGYPAIGRDQQTEGWGTLFRANIGYYF
jgi:hypothetical protein